MFLACCRSPSVGIFLSPHFAELVGDARRFSFNDSQNALGHIAALDAFFGKFSLPVRALYLFAGWARPRPLPEERADRRALAHLFRQHHDGALAADDCTRHTQCRIFRHNDPLWRRRRFLRLEIPATSGLSTSSRTAKTSRSLGSISASRCSSTRSRTRSPTSATACALY